VTALGSIGAGFSELRFFIHDVAQTGLSIRRALDEQGADVRTVIDQNYRQATSIRLILDTVRAIEARSRLPVSWPGGVDGTSLAGGWTRGCPYRGLLPFGEDDTDVFYGRELLTAELAVLAARQIRSGGMVVVTGASGAGKSSLLRAGLLPALARDQAGAGSQEWARFVITPGEAPLDRLTAPIEALGGGRRRGGALRGLLVDYPAEAAAVLRQAVEVDLLNRRREVRGAARMVLIVDQFEQLFTLNPGPEGEAERQAFIAALCAMGTGAASPGGVPPAFVVIAVRGDFWARCAEYPMLAPHLRDGQFVVGPMTEPELRLVITGPADAAGLRVEESLPDTIVRDLRTARARSGAEGGADSAGVLPLLSESMLCCHSSDQTPAGPGSRATRECPAVPLHQNVGLTAETGRLPSLEHRGSGSVPARTWPARRPGQSRARRARCVRLPTRSGCRGIGVQVVGDAVPAPDCPPLPCAASTDPAAATSPDTPSASTTALAIKRNLVHDMNHPLP
jgi:hypothetical protein